MCHIVFRFYEMSRIGKSIEKESGLVFARGSRDGGMEVTA